MLRPRRLALAGAAAAAALALTGCSQPTAANDNTNPSQDDRTITPPTVLRTPVKVPTAEPTVDLPGPTGGAPGDIEPSGGTTFSPAPPGEEGGEQAETSQSGPDGA